MDDMIYEIYTDDSGAFTVGSVLVENDDDLVVRGIDEEGKINAYYVVPKKTVVEMIPDTPYLRKVAKYMNYAKEHPFDGWFKLPALALDPKKPLLTQVLRMALKDGTLITAGRSGDDELICGYVKEIEKGRILIGCVDPETALDAPPVKLRIRDLEFIEYGSISNTLLMYANRN